MSSSESPTDTATLTTLTLTPDNPVNTTLTDDAGTIRYTAETLYPPEPKAKAPAALTHVCGSKGQTLAALEWREVRSDLVALGDGVVLDNNGDAIALKKGKEFPLSVWMKSSIIPFNSSVSFEDDKKRRYKWKGCGTGEIMELHAEDSPGSPIAQFQKPRPRANPPVPARLVIAPRAQEIMDTVVISFLFLEKGRRARDNSTQNRADVLGTPSMSLPGGRLRTQTVYKGGA